VSGEPIAPRWLPEHPERIDDPAIKRSFADRALVALIKLATRRRSYEVFRVVSIRRGLLRPMILYNAKLMPFGKLDRRQTEIVILRAAAICRAEYEWAQHVPIARRAGVTAAEIELIAAGTAGALPANDATLLAAVDELLDNHVLSDATFATLAEFLDSPRILEFCMLAGHYAGLASALNTFGVRLEPGLRRAPKN
jgi:alkylhydroperoxidase family enzyme